MNETVPNVAVGALPFTVASRPQRRFANTQTVVNTGSSGAFQIVQLPATGWVRRVSLFFSCTATAASGGALVAGDAPWNLISGITLTDATGQPVYQPITGYQLYLVNKYLPTGNQATNDPRPFLNPHMARDYAFAGTGTTFQATFRLDINFEIDAKTGYGCIPALDSNASLQLKVDYAPVSVAYTGTGVASSLTMRVSTEYWAPVGNMINGTPVDNRPPGAGDYFEVRYETQTVNASSENLVSLSARGGLVRGVLLVSRAGSTRTAVTAASQLGVLLDNIPLYEGIPIEEHYHRNAQALGYYGAELTTSYAPLGAGVMAGLDRGVVAIDFGSMSIGRDSWLNTRSGSLFQTKITPGASATTLEVITVMAQAKAPGAFYAAG